MREYLRFETEDDSVRMRTKIPFILKNRVEVFFHNAIRYKKGIRLTDAYIHCAKVGIDCAKQDFRLFNILLMKELYNEAESGESAMIIMPNDVSIAIDGLKNVMQYNRKTQALITCIGVGISLLEQQKS